MNLGDSEITVPVEKDRKVLSTAWGWVKAFVFIVCFASYAVLENEWSTGGAPAWVILVGAMWMFGGMIVMRSTKWRERWTERELWMANPFRNLFTFENKAVFFHFAAINSVAGGLGILTGGSFDLKDGRTFHGLLFYRWEQRHGLACG